MSTEPIITDAPGVPPFTLSEPIEAGNLKSRLRKHARFKSRWLKPSRDLIVYLPPMYAEHSERRFPVLYMHDGQNLFDPETSFVKGVHWRLGETADTLIGRGEIEPLIMVGVYNTGEKRIQEYTPTRAGRLGGGRADVYGRMIVQELKPFIDRNYRTLEGADHCGMGGSSLGGLVTMYLGLRYPNIFGKLAVMSPSVWWNNRVILKTVLELKQKTNQRIWLDVGTKESSRALPDARALRTSLVKKGWVRGKDLHYFEAEGADHSEGAWAERVAPMLKFLFPARH